ncbi:MAG: hypothetical protein LBF34_03620 [Puniceicoccales bacterium]|jgi:hypothetical protein|nr:hypothetical protein [Puniceicoccales bacterium]
MSDRLSSTTSNSTQWSSVNASQAVQKCGSFETPDRSSLQIIKNSRGIRIIVGKDEPANSEVDGSSMQNRSTRQITIKDFHTQLEAKKWLEKYDMSTLLMRDKNAERTADAMVQVKQTEGFQFCSPGQQAEIEAAIQQKIKEGETPESAVELGRNMVLQFKQAKEAMAADAVAQLREIENFQACTPEQQAYIESYATQMVMYGDKPEFAVKVGTDMALLYQNGIDEMLPEELLDSHKAPKITPETTDEEHEEFYELHRSLITSYKNATTEMYKVMDANGGSHKIMEFYLKRQAASSETQVSRAAQYFFAMQRQDAEPLGDNYYLGGHKKEENLAGMRR